MIKGSNGWGWVILLVLVAIFFFYILPMMQKSESLAASLYVDGCFENVCFVGTDAELKMNFSNKENFTIRDAQLEIKTEGISYEGGIGDLYYIVGIPPDKTNLAEPIRFHIGKDFPIGKTTLKFSLHYTDSKGNRDEIPLESQEITIKKPDIKFEIKQQTYDVTSTRFIYWENNEGRKWDNLILNIYVVEEYFITGSVGTKDIEFEKEEWVDGRLFQKYTSGLFTLDPVKEYSGALINLRPKYGGGEPQDVIVELVWKSDENVSLGKINGKVTLKQT